MAGYIGSRAAVATSGVERKKTFAITTTTTSLTGLDYTPNHVHVFHNGIRLVDGTDYTATNGTSITLVNAAENGDEVVVVSYGTFSPADTYTKTEADDRYVNASGDTMTGNLTVSPSSGEAVTTISSSAANSWLTFANASAAYIHNTSSTPLVITTGGTERMRIDASGNVLVGRTSQVNAEKVGISFSGATHNGLVMSDTGATGDFARLFANTSTKVGSISHTSSSTSYNTSSDYRLKEDIQPMAGASNRVLALNPVNFAWKADGTRVDGFLAHEAQAVVPEAVHGTKDEVDEDGNPVYQGIDQSKLVPLLTAALQEALNRITTLEADVAALKGATNV